MTVVPPVQIDAFQQIYAGFWKRFWALTLDRVLLFFVGSIVLFVLGSVSTIGSLILWPVVDGSFEWQGRIQTLGGCYFQLFLIDWLYFAVMESSPWQATVGKRVFGIYVTSVEGDRLRFGRATLRYFCKYLSSMICFVGFIMAAFTSKKQALHDMIAETLVMKK